MFTWMIPRNFVTKIEVMLTFLEKEGMCKETFAQHGQFWHLCTDGTKMADIFCTEGDFKQGMIALAVSIVLFAKVDLLTFELMNNHVHLILCGKKEGCMEFFTIFKGKLKRLFRGRDRVVDWNCFDTQIIEIKDLKALRNEILYVHRNAYVVNSNYTPFSYPWGGGWAYFSPVIYQLPVKSVSEIGCNKARELTHYRNVSEIARLKFVGDIPFIPSFCRVDVGQDMFRDARSYFHSITREVEAFSQIASRLKDQVFLTNEEMFRVAANYAQECFSRKLTMLTPGQKIELARKLHYDYNASNDILRRVLKLEVSVLNELFPSATT